MRLQPRDIAILREIALHGVMSRDQVIRLGFFSSVPRANARLGPLTALKLLRRIEGSIGLATRQSIYSTSVRAAEFLDDRSRAILVWRKHTPQFVDHSLMIVEVRILLKSLGAAGWRHECQLRHRYDCGEGRFEFRPDGMALVQANCLFLEIDRGHASSKSIRECFESYDRYATSGAFKRTYQLEGFRVLVVTTGSRRAANLKGIARKHRCAISVCTLNALECASSLREVLL